MSLPRFYAPPELWGRTSLHLPEREAHHALHVLRLKSGDHVAIHDGVGRCTQGIVLTTRRHDVEVQLGSHHSQPRPPWRTTLCQAMTRPKSMEFILQKAVELGISRIVPLLTERTTVKLKAEDHKPEKWHWIAVDALKQCGSAWLPEMVAPQSLQDYLKGGDRAELSFLGALDSQRHPHSCFTAFLEQRGRPPASLSAWIGPEGDFTPQELHSIQAAGAVPVSFGRNILRSETAALYCLSFLNYELQLLHPSPST